MIPSRVRLATVLAAAGALTLACGGATVPAAAPGSATDALPPAPSATTPHDAMSDDHTPAHDGAMDHGYGPGAGGPAEASAATRTIAVSVDDSFAFAPETFSVRTGEVVTFLVANVGNLEHEFVLGDGHTQAEMEAAMAGGGAHAHDGSDNAVTVHGGESAELTWRFDQPGEVLVGCHVAGHWDAGMRVVVTVTG